MKALRRAFAALEARADAPPHRFARFDLGFCRSCQRLRSTASLRCQHCGSTRPVNVDA
jgi:hypothetical protein